MSKLSYAGCNIHRHRQMQLMLCQCILDGGHCTCRNIMPNAILHITDLCREQSVARKGGLGHMFQASTDSLFCRMATSVYWTPDQLRSCSVTGTLSNKSRAKGVTEPRPASTPEKVASLKGLQHIAYRSYTATCSVLFQFEITSASVNVASGVADYCAVHLFRFSNLVMFINYRNSVC